MQLTFHYDVVCPYAWLAAQAISELADRTGVHVAWSPVLLGGILRAVDAPDVPASTWAPAKAAMGARDLARQAELRGVPLSLNPRHPVRTVDAMRLCCAAPDDVRPALSVALFEANHVHGQDLADRSVLADIAGRFGLAGLVEDAPGMPAPITTDAVKDDLRQRTDLAVKRGMFGVPAFWLAREEPGLPGHRGRFWWGADRMHLVEAALRGVTSRAEAPEDLRISGPLDRRPRPRTAGSATLELFHDFSSPFSYLGFTQAARVAAAHDASLVLKPMLLGALFREIGTPMVPIAAMNAAKAKYAARDLDDQARWWGVPFTFPDCFPVRTVTALRVAIQAPDVTAHIYRALWSEGRDIGQDDVLRAVLDEAGFDGASLITGTARPEIKEILKDHTAEAVAIGGCGAPTWRVRGADRSGRPLPDVVVWGQDRLDLVGALLDGWRPHTG